MNQITITKQTRDFPIKFILFLVLLLEIKLVKYIVDEIDP